MFGTRWCCQAQKLQYYWQQYWTERSLLKSVSASSSSTAASSPYALNDRLPSFARPFSLINEMVVVLLWIGTTQVHSLIFSLSFTCQCPLWSSVFSAASSTPSWGMSSSSSFSAAFESSFPFFWRQQCPRVLVRVLFVLSCCCNCNCISSSLHCRGDPKLSSCMTNTVQKHILPLREKINIQWPPPPPLIEPQQRSDYLTFAFLCRCPSTTTTTVAPSLLSLPTTSSSSSSPPPRWPSSLRWQ